MNIREFVRNLAKLFIIFGYSDIIINLINKNFPYLISNFPYRNDILYFIYYAYMFMTLFIISWKFGKYIENLFLYYLNSLVMYLYYFMICIVILFNINLYTSLSNQYVNLIYNFFEIYSDYFLIIFVILFPLGALLNKTQLVRIEFTMVENNFENFTKRQKWMKKIFKRLTKELERGNIKVSHDDLLSNFNRKAMPYEYIDDIEKWMINEKNDTAFFYSLKQIIPEKDVKSIEKISYRNIIFRILEPEYFKYFWIPFMLLLAYYFEPDIFDKILEKLSISYP